ncbi:molybdopterin molybdotransferase MoeA [Streptomyces triculaminicus]|uniref:molybdopterin molybdotransferase MoeA n=1 Tax=Streptomyces triculaminicus TaxID=2816232 RepID=UPI0033E86166
MRDLEGDSGLDRATDEALSLLADERRAAPGPGPRAGSAHPGGGRFFFDFVEDPFADEATSPPPGRPAGTPAGRTPRTTTGTGTTAETTTGTSDSTPAGTTARAAADDELDVPFAGVRFYDTMRPREGTASTPPSPRAGSPAGPSPLEGDPAGPAPDSPAHLLDAPHAMAETHLSWAAARAAASRAAQPLEPTVRPLGDALGHLLAARLTALTDLPSFDTSAMDGWAVAGPGPWRLPKDGGGVLAGHGDAGPLADGEAVPIATGARVPSGATAVLRSEHGTVRMDEELYASRHLTQGQDIRPKGQECQAGDVLLSAGTLVTPAVLGLAAAAGYDQLRVVPRPRVEVLVLGDELLREGLPHDGLIRDALGPMLAPWLRSLGAEVAQTRCLGDDETALRAALEASDADVVLTTGGTAAGPVDHVHPTLRRLGAELLVDGVAVRPGHPMLLARLASGRHLVGLPGNPLAAVAGLLTLAEPLLRALAGRSPALPVAARLTEPVAGHPTDTRLVPVVRRGDGTARPLSFHGPAMLRGLAAADALAVIPPGGTVRGGEALLLTFARHAEWYAERHAEWHEAAGGGAP